MAHFTMVGRLWERLPIILRAVVTGFVVTSAGTIPWAFVASLNLKYLSEIPWAVLPAALYIWFFWKYVRGTGWPRTTAEFRRKNCRAFDLPGDVWASAIGAGLLGLWALVLFQSVYGRMVNLPAQSTEDLAGVPTFTVFALVAMSSVVAGITEESGLRGYMQRPLEVHYGPVVAILVTGVVFGVMHFTHREVTIALMPWYMGVALVYGALAYLTGSILPCVVLHAGGNMLGALQLLATGRAEWQAPMSPRMLIWDTGADAAFWMASIGFIAVTAAAVWAYSGLARTARAGSV